MTLASEVYRLRLSRNIRVVDGLKRLARSSRCVPRTAVLYYKAAMPCCLKRGRTISASLAEELCLLENDVYHLEVPKM
jgi:hypothetical protein